ncbi:MAG: 6-bladed beta-propeller [Prolixibacteraceae bacterium]|jgi:hypothetical protein|nr:6-bladed beta-propeller [Prolixibacteraceae bacterium]
MFKYIIIITVAIVAQSCNKTSNTTPSNIESIKINVNASNENLDVSSLIKRVTKIKLETNDRCLLKNIKKIEITKNNLLIFDDFVYVFDLKGKFQYKIGKKGKGPGEIINAIDFIYDQTNKNIELFDFAQNKLIIYSLRGDYIKEIKFPFGLINRFEKKDNGDYVTWKTLNNQKKNKKGFIGNKLQIGNLKNGFKEYKPCYEYDGNYRLSQSFSKCGDKLYFWEMLNDTIFEINAENDFMKKFHIDFGKNKIPEQLLQIPPVDRIFALRDKYEVATAIDNFYYCSKFTYFNFVHNKKLHNVLLTDGSLKLGNCILFNDVQYSKFTYFNGSNLVATVEYPDKISQSLKNTLDKEFHISDNPIIFLFEL